MSDPKLVSPLLDGFIMGEPMSDHHGVRCCPAIREGTDERYIVKIISIPATQVQLDALLLSGAYADNAGALAYFKDLSEDVINEKNILDRLSRLEGFIPFSASQTVEMTDAVGYDVYLLSPYRRTLDKQMCSEPLTHLAAVNLGLDMCAALHASRKAGYLYVDLKPSNIFDTENYGYRIGDLGFIPLTSLKYASLPEKYRSSHTAPEIADAMSALNDTIDIYALGLTLYQVYNNGKMPFEGEAPTSPLPPPLYADYEMAEIILKACDPDPQKRWQDPAQMGQELVNYMQRNCIDDTSIVPPPIELVEETEEIEEFLTEDENDAQMEELLAQLPEEVCPDEEVAAGTEAPAEEDETDLSFITDEATDETLPSEESTAELEDAPVTEEVAQMLAQADDLIAHELPEPVVAPDPIDVPIPPPIQPEPEPEEPAEAPQEPSLVEETAETEEHIPVEDTEEVTAEEPTEEETEEVETEAEDAIEPEEPADEEEDDPYPPVIVKKPKVWFSLIVTAVLLAAVAIGGWFMYHNFYLQTIDDLTIQADAEQIIVSIESDVDESLLTVICTDTYGNSKRSSVVDGKAVFENLNPNTQYKIQLSISGPHKLLGTTSASHTTPAQTEVLNFTAICGPEDGSVILNFSVNGPEKENWTVEYFADGIAPLTKTFSGHSVTITDLTLGADYTFRLVPGDDIRLTGQQEVKFTAQKIIYAQNLTISACGNGSLTAVWTAPEGAEGTIWSVRCYNDAGYDQTLTTTEQTVTFTDLDHSTAYTVQVIAIGMTQSTTASVTANPITVTGFTTDLSTPHKLTLNWTFNGTAPTGWVLVCTINDGAPMTLECPSNTASVPLFPGMHYAFTLKPVDGVTFYCEDFAFDAPAATTFTGYGVTAANMTFSMCLTPSKANWDRYDLKNSDYTTTFAVGQKASFLVKLATQYAESTDMIATTFIIRDGNNHLIRSDSTSQTWKKMWHKRYCELDIPQLPTTPGTYTVDIYFNDLYVTSQTFTVQ